MYQITAVQVSSRVSISRTGRRVRRLPQIILPNGALIKLAPGRSVVIDERTYLENKDRLSQWGETVRIKSLATTQEAPAHEEARPVEEEAPVLPTPEPEPAVEEQPEPPQEEPQPEEKEDDAPIQEEERPTVEEPEPKPEPKPEPAPAKPKRGRPKKSTTTTTRRSRKKAD